MYSNLKYLRDTCGNSLSKSYLVIIQRAKLIIHCVTTICCQLTLCPISPFAPGMPCVPVSPFLPMIPGDPFEPGIPMSPGSPF